jgi:hypothetical protein
VIAAALGLATACAADAPRSTAGSADTAAAANESPALDGRVIDSAMTGATVRLLTCDTALREFRRGSGLHSSTSQRRARASPEGSNSTGVVVGISEDDTVMLASGDSGHRTVTPLPAS